uniref:Uncharacterized protein n=1 Tax=Magallana gigas TaxID=29159 RepID=A0A8W8MMT0_MAGGI
MIVIQVSDVFVSKTSTHRVVRLDQGGGVSIKMWGSKSSISPGIGSSIEAKCLKVASYKDKKEFHSTQSTTIKEVEEQEKSFAGIITSIDFDSGLANVEVKGIEESILIPPALLQELFPTSVFSTRLPLTGIKVGNKLVRIQRQTTLGSSKAM